MNLARAISFEDIVEMEKFEIDFLHIKAMERDGKSLKKVMEIVARGEEHTVVVVPSLSFDPESVENIRGVVHYETRSLWEVLRASSDNTNIVFISSLPIDDDAFDYFLSMLPDPECARKRIKLFSLDDSRASLSLTDKIMESSDFIQKIKNELDPKNTYLKTFISSNRENDLAESLGIPFYGNARGLEYYQTKSGNRKIFEESNILFADGISDIKTVEDLVNSVEILWAKYKNAKRFIVKLNSGVSGDGNAILELPCSYDVFFINDLETRMAMILGLLKELRFHSCKMNWNLFCKRIIHGAVLENFIEGEEKNSPSAQVFVHSDGRIEMLSTHEQILDENGFSFLGGIFPANKDYRRELQDSAMKVAVNLRRHGIIGVFAIDFLVVHDEEKSPKIWAIEINVREGGTTHPYRTAKLLTESWFDTELGVLIDGKGNQVCYMSNDNVTNDGLVGTRVSEFLGFMKKEGILFSRNGGKGVVFHLLNALGPCGKVGYTAIGGCSEEAEMFYTKAIEAVEKFIISRSV